MADTDNENDEDIVLNVVDNSIIAYSYAKQFAASVYFLAAWGVWINSQAISADHNALLFLSSKFLEFL
ncbi:hypothetical protein BH23CHL1_BH23CHL1_22700 [soil metagenome]